MSIILGIETSCDETGAAIVRGGQEVLVNLVASQVDVHREFGGVVPEIASRQHTTVISQLVRKALDETSEVPDAVAVTAGPGLMGSLLVGLSYAKALALAWEKPCVAVNHLEGHIFSAFLGDPKPTFPFLALLVSGGHTMLLDCRAPHDYEMLGTTRDDAVGESFDKVARLIGLGYPGGPAIQKAAEQGDPSALALPRAMRKRGNLDFSYSGLKTAVLYALRDNPDLNPADVAASFQEAAVDMLIQKCLQAIEETGAGRLVIAGGVAANKRLRERAYQDLPVDVFIPPFAYCLDNGAMIAAAGDSLLEHGCIANLRQTANPAMPLTAMA